MLFVKTILEAKDYDKKCVILNKAIMQASTYDMISEFMGF